MGEDGTVLGLVGSPNREGRTNSVVTAALEGAAGEGARTELVQMADHLVAACKDCLPWVCLTNLKCTYKDEAFETLCGKVLKCSALVLGTPVYWGDTSGLVRYFILKMFRVYARSAPLKGLPALGIGIAGGTGNGLVSGVRPVYHFFRTMHMKAIEPLPVTRFSFDADIAQARKLGAQLVNLSKKAVPFANLEERLLWYDDLPYLSLSRFEERRLLADLVSLALPEGGDASLYSGLALADTLAAAGRTMEAMEEISSVYDACVKAFDGA